MGYVWRGKPPDVPLCQCGCGEPVRIATKTDRRYGCVKGQPRRYLSMANGERCWIDDSERGAAGVLFRRIEETRRSPVSEPIELIPATDGKGGYSPEFLAALRGEAAATPDDSTAPDPVTAGHDGPCIYVLAMFDEDELPESYGTERALYDCCRTLLGVLDKIAPRGEADGG